MFSAEYCLKWNRVICKIQNYHGYNCLVITYWNLNVPKRRPKKTSPVTAEIPHKGPVKLNTETEMLSF